MNKVYSSVAISELMRTCGCFTRKILEINLGRKVLLDLVEILGERLQSILVASNVSKKRFQVSFDSHPTTYSL